MKHVGWWIGAMVLTAGCSAPVPTNPTAPYWGRDDIYRPQPHDSLGALQEDPQYLTRSDQGERRILGQLLHELRLARHLIDEAHARRDVHGRVRIDYVRLASEFDRILMGLRRTLAAVETAPRDPMEITGDYQLYE